MKLFRRSPVNRLTLVLVGLGRNKVRTLLTMASVTVAVFLFCALGAVLDTLKTSIQVSSVTRLITRNAISLVFPLPIAYRERIAAVPGVKTVSVSNWFGGEDPANPKNWFAQFAVDAPTYFSIYGNEIEITEASTPQAEVSLPAGMDPKLAAFMSERQACVVGDDLMKTMNWKLGQTVTLKGTIYPGSWPFTIRAVYHPKSKVFDASTLLFHWDYLNEKGMVGRSFAGIFTLELSTPDRAGDIAKQVDAMYENSAARTHTETERAFQAGFVSMYGNIPFVMRVVGLAVVFSILLVASNTMLMAFRDRTSEFAVLKTLGYDDGMIFGLVLAEAAVITVGGGVAGALLAKLLIQDLNLRILPPMVVEWSTVYGGIGMALALGAVSGLIPAWQAARLRIVDALRRV